MIENLKKSVERKSFGSGDPESPATLARGVEIVSAIEEINKRLDEDVASRYGKGFYDRAYARINDWYEQSFQKGEDIINWAELKGFPLPKSKVGMRVLSGVTGITGTIIPGLGVLLLLAVVLWMRGGHKGTDSAAVAGHERI